MKTESGHTLITGASSGIGRALAREFSKRGHRLVLLARRLDLLRELAAELGGESGNLLLKPLDLTCADAVSNLQADLRTAGIGVGILVNNAGIGKAGHFAGHPLESDLRMLDLNARVPLELCKRFLPEMLLRGEGRILNVVSTAAFQPGPNLAVYYATKSFLLSFSEALSRETRGTGVTVTAFCPGPTATDFHRQAGMLQSRGVRGRRLPSASTVAASAYRATMKGKPVAVHGVLNRALLLLVRLAPRSWVREAVYRLQANPRGN